MAKRKKRIEFVKFNTIKTYIKDVIGMKAGTSATNKLKAAINSTTRDIIKDAEQIAKDEGKKTILARHLDEVIPNHIGKRKLTAEETTEQILNKTPTEIAQISAAIQKFLRTGRK